MNDDADALKLLRCARHADADCMYCAAAVIEEAMKQWPEFDWRGWYERAKKELGPDDMRPLRWAFEKVG